MPEEKTELRHVTVPDIMDGWIQDPPPPPEDKPTHQPKSRFVRDWNELKNPLTATFHFKEVGNFILGRLVGVRKNVGENKATVYDLEIEDSSHAQGGYRLSVWGKTDLDGKINRHGNPSGKYLYAELVEITPTGDGDRTWFEFLVKLQPPRRRGFAEP